MDTIVFYVCAVAFCVLGTFCMRNTSPYYQGGRDEI